MRKTILLILLILSLCVSGCMEPTGTPGRYYSEECPSDYLELKSDGTYVVSQKNSFSGDYTIDRDIVRLIFVWGSFDMEQDGNILVDPEGDRWVK